EHTMTGVQVTDLSTSLYGYAADYGERIATMLGALASIPVSYEVVDISSEIEHTMTGVQVTGFSTSLDGYAADYGERIATLLGTLASIPVPFEAVDIPTEIEHTMTGAQVTDLTQNLADYGEYFATLGDTVATIQVPRGVVDISAKIEHTMISAQVTGISRNFGGYVAHYGERFATLGGTFAGIHVPRGAVDISAKIEHALTTGVQVPDPTKNVDDFVADYGRRFATIRGKLAGIPVPREVVDIAAKIERTLASDQVTDLTENLDDYLAEYAARFTVVPRRSDSPMEVAESYLRDYQPGPLPRVFQTTIIYDRNGVRLAEIFDEGKRTWVSLDAISPHLIDAVIATEDSSFYENPGIDPRRVIGAFLQNAEAGGVVSGASTITMQLARMLFFSTEDRFEQSMERKIFEALLAQELSSLYTKDEILEMYLNMTHFGRQAYGIEAASQEFFGKTAADLSLAEATLLAGMPQKPGGYDLLADIEPVKDRQRTVLSLMVRHGYLTQVEADEVYAEEVYLNYDSLTPTTLAPHFVQYVKDEMNRRLEGDDISRAGLRVFTTLDVNLQAVAEKVVSEQVEILKPQFDLSNAALVALKPGTGEILAMVGSANFNDPAIDGQVNVATSPRQPGSAIKPILYATAIEDSLVSPASIIWDVPAEYKLSDTEDYKPVNYDEEFHGPVTVRTALANSYNIPAIKLLDG
ncbi:MAG: transglycosylase domain-containing protein, partial [Caldilineaceae bacterium]